MQSMTPSDSGEDQRSGGYELYELIKEMYLLNSRGVFWSLPVYDPVTQNRTEAQMASVLA
jgi:hypothetical protein